MKGFNLVETSEFVGKLFSDDIWEGLEVPVISTENFKSMTQSGIDCSTLHFHTDMGPRDFIEELMIDSLVSNEMDNFGDYSCDSVYIDESEGLIAVINFKLGRHSDYDPDGEVTVDLYKSEQLDSLKVILVNEIQSEIQLRAEMKLTIALNNLISAKCDISSAINKVMSCLAGGEESSRQVVDAFTDYAEKLNADSTAQRP